MEYKIKIDYNETEYKIKSDYDAENEDEDRIPLFYYQSSGH